MNQSQTLNSATSNKVPSRRAWCLGGGHQDKNLSRDGAAGQLERTEKWMPISYTNQFPSLYIFLRSVCGPLIILEEEEESFLQHSSQLLLYCKLLQWEQSPSFPGILPELWKQCSLWFLDTRMVWESLSHCQITWPNSKFQNKMAIETIITITILNISVVFLWSIIIIIIILNEECI